MIPRRPREGTLVSCLRLIIFYDYDKKTNFTPLRVCPHLPDAPATKSNIAELVTSHAEAIATSVERKDSKVTNLLFWQYSELLGQSPKRIFLLISSSGADARDLGYCHIFSSDGCLISQGRESDVFATARFVYRHGQRKPALETSGSNGGN